MAPLPSDDYFVLHFGFGAIRLGRIEGFYTGLALVLGQESFAFFPILLSHGLAFFFTFGAGFLLVGHQCFLRLLIRELKLASGEDVLHRASEAVHIKLHSAAFNVVADAHADGIAHFVLVRRRRLSSGRLILCRARGLHGHADDRGQYPL